MKLDIKQNVTLSPFATFKIGGNADYFVEVDTKDEVREGVEFARKNSLSVFVLGGGSNVLIGDEGIKGIVIKPVNKSFEVKGSEVTIGAGMQWDDAVEKTVELGFQGVECLSLIPGTVGAAAVQNIGAYGQEIKDTLVGVTAVNLFTGNVEVFSKWDLKLSYRDSVFKTGDKKGKYLVYDVTLKLNKNKSPNPSYESLVKYLDDNNINNPSLKEVRDAVINIRTERLVDPVNTANAGSFFKNPIVDGSKLKSIQKKFPNVKYYQAGKSIKLFAGWLIEKVGWKGKAYKGVGVSRKNALVLINHKGSAKEIVELMNLIIKDVDTLFGVVLEPEIQIVNS